VSSHADTNRLSDDTVRYIQRMQAHRDELEAENQQLRDALHHIGYGAISAVLIRGYARDALAAVRVEDESRLQEIAPGVHIRVEER
jgi:hypothetical protein